MDGTAISCKHARRFGYPFVQFCLLQVFFLIASVSSFAQIRNLDPGQSVSAAIAPAQKHSYKVELERSRFYSIELRELAGTDVIISVYGPNHRLVARIGGYKGIRRIDGHFSMSSWDITMTLPFIAKFGGTHTIVIDARDSSITGKYEVNLSDGRPATSNEIRRITAQKHFEIAEHLRLEAITDEDLKTAILNYRAALAIYIELGDVASQVNAQNAIGLCTQLAGNLTGAIEIFERSKGLILATGDQLKTTTTLNFLAGAYRAIGRDDLALAELTVAIKIARDIGNKTVEARLLTHFAWAAVKVAGDDAGRERAVAILEQVVKMMHELGNPTEETMMLYQIAAVCDYISDKKRSAEAYRRGLAIARKIGYRDLIVMALLRLGEISFDHGEFQQAFDDYDEAHEYSRGMGNYYEAYTLYNLSNSSLTLDKKKVFEYLNAALPMWYTNRNGVAYTLNSLGRYYFSEGRTHEALQHYMKAIPIMDASGDKYGVGMILTNIGETYSSIGNNKKALEFYSRARELHRSQRNRRDEARTLISIGNVLRSAGDLATAASNFDEALRLYNEIGNRSGQANAYYAIAKVFRERGDITAAREKIESALQIVETLRAGIAGTEMRSAYFARVQDYYEFYADLLMTLHGRQPETGYNKQALEVAEKGIARNLLELLCASNIDLREGVDPSLLEKEAQLQKRFEQLTAKMVVDRKSVENVKQAAASENEMRELIEELRSIEGRINAASPIFAKLTSAAPLSVAGIQKLLDENTSLLEFKLGTERSFLWVVEPEGVKSFILPGRAEIERSARPVYELLTARNMQGAVDRAKTSKGRASRSADQYETAAKRLSTILFGKASTMLRGKRLLIVSDGLLQFIPFGALPDLDPKAAGENAQYEKSVPMLVSHEIVYLPSASTLDILRREAEKRHTATEAVAVIADPVFSQDDVRITSNVSFAKVGQPHSKTPAKPKSKFAVSTQRALDDFGLNRIVSRLPFSRREADSIASLLPNGKVVEKLDFAASRSAAINPSLSNYRILHFATHGLLNSSHPELSGLLFSLYNEKGEPENGFLTLQEIYHLKINADLVVLSACQTGLGRDVRGEGLAGLTRGFMHAGTSRVVASLWKVDDAATAELMREFYTSMLRDGMSPSAALRSAQVKMLNSQNWKHPYYWAAFTSQGEWR